MDCVCFCDYCFWLCVVFVFLSLFFLLSRHRCCWLPFLRRVLYSVHWSPRHCQLTCTIHATQTHQTIVNAARSTEMSSSHYYRAPEFCLYIREMRPSRTLFGSLFANISPISIVVHTTLICVCVCHTNSRFIDFDSTSFTNLCCVHMHTPKSTFNSSAIF